MPLKINSVGGGSVTLDATNTPLNTTLTLPATSGTFVFTNGNNTIQFAGGFANTPSITRFGDTNTGMFFPAADTIAFAEGGVEALRINSSAQIEFTAGTVSLPSITASGDTNTGMFFPAADTIAFSEGGVEAMRLDSSGRVGIGTTSPLYRLHVYTSATNGTDGITVAGGATTNRTVEIRPAMGAGTNNGIVQAGDSGIIFAAGSSNTGAFVIAPWNSSTNGIRIVGSTGNIGIGVASPAVRLHTVGTSDEIARFDSSAANPYISLYRQGTRMGFWYAPGGTYTELSSEGRALFLSTTAAHEMRFLTNSVERMRIQSSGFDIAVGITTSYYTQANRGTLTVGGTTDALVAVGGGGVASGYLYGSSTVLNLTADAKPLQLAATGANIISFITNGTERARVASDGHFVPAATNTYDLGTTSLRWRNIFTQDLHLSNGIGDYTVIEGEENLYIVNNKSKKSFKFALIEVDPKEVPPKSGD